MIRRASTLPLALVFLAAGLFLAGLVLIASQDALSVRIARIIAAPLAVAAMPAVLISASTNRVLITRGLLVLALLSFCVAMTFLGDPYPEGLLADLRGGHAIHPLGAVLALIVFLPFVVLLGKGLGAAAAVLGVTCLAGAAVLRSTRT